MLGRDPLADPAADRAMALTGAGYVPLGQVAGAAKLGKDAGWDESAHPRWPAGAEEGQGGRFAPGGGAGGSSAQATDAAVGSGEVVPAADRATDDAEGGFCAPSPLSPPGDCTEEQFRDLQQRVENACGAAARCVGGESPEVLQYKIAGQYACIRARMRINDTCFRGGDDGHNKQIAQRYNAIKNCYNLGGGIPR